MNTPQSHRSRVCIVTTVRQPGPPMYSFVRYHLKLGVERIFLFFDDPKDPDLQLAHQLEGVTAIPCSQSFRSEEWPKSPLYNEIQPFIDKEVIARQVLNAEVALRWAVESGIQWILHIDIDELLHLNQEATRYFSGIPDDVGRIRFLNHEAVPETLEVDDYFQEVTLFKRQPRMCVAGRIKKWLDAGNRRWYFLAYNNGKCAVRAAPGVTTSGVHDFRPPTGMRTHVPFLETILHYSNCGLSRYIRKYQHRGTFSDRHFDKRPRLEFHLMSRDVVGRGNLDEITEFYQRHVVLSRRHEIRELVDSGLGLRVETPSALLVRGNSVNLNEHHSNDSLCAAAQETQKVCPHGQNTTANDSAGGVPEFLQAWNPEEMTHTFVIPSPNVQITNVDGAAVLLHLDTGVYHALNQVGTVMWELFAPDRSLAQVLSAMLEKYDVTEDMARADLNKLVTLLVNAKLVEIEKKEPVHHAV